ncbi:MAG: metal-dependent hydrolase [Thioalkalispiraceae bacterium]
MFIAHLPAGFLLTRAFLKNEREEPDYIKFLLIGLLASIAPDFDLAYFHLIDHRAHPHHSYWTHIPVYWISIYAFLSYPVYKLSGRRSLKLLTVILLSGLLHMTLDSVASGIKWLYPFDNAYFGLWRIPAVHDWWVANYLFHWTFLIELVITTMATLVFIHDSDLRSDMKYQFLIWLYQIRPSTAIMEKLVNSDNHSGQK